MRCAKPTHIEKESSKVMLGNVEAQICGVCCQEEDRYNAGVDYMKWLECGTYVWNLDKQQMCPL